VARNTHLKSQYGPWAVITGASEGIGRQIAVQLAEIGLNLVLVARRQTILEDLAADLHTKYDVETQVFAADLAQPQALQNVIAVTEALDVGLFVAAAGFGTSGAFISSSLDSELSMLDVNCRAVVTMSHHYGKRFADQRRGGIILFSSLVAFQGVPNSAHYAATKAFIQSFAEGLSHELAQSGVDVLASAPGPVDSGFAARANMQMGAALTPEAVARDTLNALGRKRNVRPGFLSKFLIGSLQTMPRQWRVRAMQQIMGSMTRHQNTQSPTTLSIKEGGNGQHA
jgi:short-subunit dehydrogenase